VATTLEELSVLITADIAQFTAGMAQTEASLGRVGASAEVASAVVDKANQRITDSAGRVRDGFGKFVNAAQLAKEASQNVGGSFSATALKADGLASNLNGALAASFAAFDKQSAELNKGLGRVATGTKDAGTGLTTFLTVPLLAAGGAALKIGGDFEAAFNQVEAATLASGKELDSLRDKAQNIALDPNLKFSSVEAANALENLAKNGLNTAQILGGAADATTALATATGGKLATAADITTDVMAGFGKSAADAAALVSNITGTTIASKLSIDDYRLALGQAGAVAGQLGVNFEDFNTALSVTSSGFSSGADAGTSFKTFIQRLQPATKEAAEAMQKLGLNFFDAQGKMRPLRDIAGQLQTAFKGLSDQQRNSLGTEIFGADSIRTALLLAKDGVKGFDEMQASIAKVNAASQGKILSQGFVGSFEAFKSSLEGLADAVANSGILDFATKLAQKGSELASNLAKADPELLKLGVSLGVAAASVGPLLYGIGRLGELLIGAKAAFAAFGLTTGAALLPVLGTVAAVGAAGYLLIKNWDSVVSYFNGPDGAVFSDLASSIAENASIIGSELKALANGPIGEFIGQFVKLEAALLGKGIQAGIAIISSALTVFAGEVRVVSDLISGNFSKALDDARIAAGAAVKPFQDLFGFTQRTREGFEGAAHGGGIFGDSLLHASGLLTGFNSQLQGFKGGLPGEELKKLATAADTSGLALGKVGGLSEAATKAFAKLREELARLGLLDNLLGDAPTQMEVLERRASTIEKGLKSLIDAGVTPSSRAFRALADEATGLNISLDKLRSSPSLELKPVNVKSLIPQTIGDSLPQDVARLLGDYAKQAKPFELPAAVKFNIQSTVSLADQLKTGLNTELLNIGKSFREIEAGSQLGVLFDEAGAKAGVLQTAIQNLIAGGTSPLDANLQQLSGKFKQLSVDAAATQVVKSAVMDLAGGISDAFADALSGTQSIGDGLTKTLLSTVGNLATELGSILLASGLGIEALKVSLKSFTGVGAIAAGLGLLAIGGLAKSAMSNLGKSGGGAMAAPGGSLAARPPSSFTQSTNAANQNMTITIKTPEYRLRGADLVNAAKSHEYRVSRTN
jgi:TP901 family phage tail tape measure protein